jgi:hypothetical protein
MIRIHCIALTARGRSPLSEFRTLKTSGNQRVYSAQNDFHHGLLTVVGAILDLVPSHPKNQVPAPSHVVPTDTPLGSVYGGRSCYLFCLPFGTGCVRADVPPGGKVSGFCSTVTCDGYLTNPYFALLIVHFHLYG